MVQHTSRSAAASTRVGVFFEGGDTVKFKALIASVAFIAFGTATAGAADLPVRVPPPPLVPGFSWTGFYIGANIGGAWAHDNLTDTLFLTNFNGNNEVFIGGGQIGGNYQIGGFVIGGEWDFDWAANNNGGTGVAVPAVGTIVVTNNNHWITTMAARFGYAFDHLLLFGKVGGGWVGSNNPAITNVSTGVSLTCGNFTNCGNSNGGWLVGAGAEWMFVPNWSVKVEYDYLGLGNRTFLIPATAPFLAGDTFTANNRNVQMLKFGVNYLFNWGTPVAAKYY
jgi:outer membrane immunogenic protein